MLLHRQRRNRQPETRPWTQAHPTLMIIGEEDIHWQCAGQPFLSYGRDDLHAADRHQSRSHSSRTLNMTGAGLQPGIAADQGTILEAKLTSNC
jgi:hypothetical protein